MKFFKKTSTALVEPKSDDKAKKSRFCLILALLIGSTALQLKSLYEQIATNWQEYVFVWQKPQIVKQVRVQYQEKQQALDQSFSNREKTSEEKLMEAVASELKGAPSK